MCSVAALEIITMSPRGRVRIVGRTNFEHDHAPKACVRTTRSSSAGSVSATVCPRDALPGVVDEDVDVTEVGDRGADHRLALRVVVDRRRVRLARAGPASRSRRRSRARRLVAAVVHRDVGAVGRETERDRPTDAAATAGHQRHASFEHCRPSSLAVGGSSPIRW